MTAAPLPSLALVILDGWGLAEPGPGNAISLAKTPVFDRLWGRVSPHPALRPGSRRRPARGPDGQLRGRPPQPRRRGDRQAGPGADRRRRSPTAASLRTRRCWPLASAARNSPRGRLHLLGLVSDGGVHSGWEHIEATDRAGHPGGCPRRRLSRLHRRSRHASPRRPRLPRRARALAAPRRARSPPSAVATTRWIATPVGSGPSSPTTRSSTAAACTRPARRRRSRPPMSAARPTSSSSRP